MSNPLRRPTPVAPWQDPAAQPFLRIQNVTKTYGKVYACDDVSLDSYQGELFALLGGSGSGKSTLLRILAGLVKPDRGSILIDGVDISALPPYERPVNMMFQSYALFPHMTVEQNIAFGLKQDRLPAAEVRERVAHMLELVKMPDLGKRKPDQLSGGQRQRVALARSLAKQPKLLLLDEPLGALDRKLREHTQFELMNIQERVGTTFVLVTHDQEEAMTMASRLAVMNAGMIEQVSTPAGLYEYPAPRFVAEFIGWWPARSWSIAMCWMPKSSRAIPIRCRSARRLRSRCGRKRSTCTKHRRKLTTSRSARWWKSPIWVMSRSIR